MANIPTDEIKIHTTGEGCKRVFTIRKIIVHETCNKEILKILQPGEYEFSDSRYDGDKFFLEGITICSIVGKNGCGKSSLIELLFRMVNNLGAMMLKGFDRPASEDLFFIDGVEADMYYSINEKPGMLCCKSDLVTLEHNGYSFEWSTKSEECIYKINGTVQKKYDFVGARNLAEHFFYLVATNYSMHAYIDTDYQFETIYSWQPQINQHWSVAWHKESGESWINSVFHKNDGYMCPIVLNPYRNNGKVDMAKEAKLTTNRLCALFLQTQDKYQIIEGYRLAFIMYQFNQSYLLDKFDRNMLSKIPRERISDKFFYAYMQQNSYSKAILDGFGIDATSTMNFVELTLRLYLVYKTFSIAEKYPQYGHFKPLGQIDNAFKSNPNKTELEQVKILAQRINQRNTHIELKIHQTLNLIQRLDKSKDKTLFDKPLTYDKINNLLGIEPHCESVLDRMSTLPPPLFKPTIYLIKDEVYKDIIRCTNVETERKQKIADNTITLSKLSSGERQFIYTISTILYHAFNIQSIPNFERVAYRNLCLVLEEVEICFHPEYQRTFINNLINLFKRTELNKSFGIFVIVVTHSPFVLSDVPKENILYLDNGYNVTNEKHLNTFGANVNELLCQSFFLSDGFMGEFAKNKIVSLLDYLENDITNDYWTEEKAKEVISIVGDEVIQHQLRQLFAARFKNSDYYRNWIAREAKRLGINNEKD